MSSFHMGRGIHDHNCVRFAKSTLNSIIYKSYSQISNPISDCSTSCGVECTMCLGRTVLLLTYIDIRMRMFACVQQMMV